MTGKKHQFFIYGSQCEIFGIYGYSGVGGGGEGEGGRVAHK